MSDYKHGTYGELIPVSISPQTSPSCVVYVGTAPAHKIKGQSENQAGLFNTPLRIASLNDARKFLGYADPVSFKKYTLCEAVEAHFKNSIENIGPIYCVNVLDPNLEGNFFEDTDGVKLDVLKKQAKLVLGDLMLDSIQIESTDSFKEDQEVDELDSQAEEAESTSLKEDEDYTLDYDSTTDMVTITFIGEEIPTAILVKGKIVNPFAVGAKEVIGEVTETGHKTGLQAIKNMYTKYSEIVNLICAPGFSEIPEVYEAMCKIAVKLNGHWDAFVTADIPLKDGAKDIDTNKKIIQWKKDHDYTNGRSAVCWVKGTRRNEKQIHASTLLTVTMQALDKSSNGIPFQSPSNKEVDVIGLYGGENFEGFDPSEANELNAHGIVTLIFWGGAYRIWGSHTAAYDYETEVESTMNPDLVFDRITQYIPGVRTFFHITNGFQADNFDLIDQPMTNAIKDFIIQKEQSKLDNLVSIGALLGQPKIYFSEDNSAGQVMGGNFVWDITATTNVPLKSATVRLGYTDTGLYTLFGEGE